jgi:hypothetical protein
VDTAASAASPGAINVIPGIARIVAMPAWS